MQNQIQPSRVNRAIVMVVVFVVIFGAVMIIALMNAPTMGGPRVMATIQTYLAEVQQTAIPFMIAVGIAALALAIVAVVAVRRVWNNRKHRSELFTAYAFLAPYLVVTLTFTIGVVLFALYISFNNYDIFTRPTWVGLENYSLAFKGFTDSTQRDFLQSLITFSGLC
jgi:hypothetical protein